MTTITRTTALTLITSLTLVVAGSAAASGPQAKLVAPTPGYNLPTFGFNSYNIANYGERVTNVRWGGLASQLGLERGDTILRLNGYPLTYHGAWNDALYRAISDGGWVQLTIRDVRTRHIVTRQMVVDSPGYGPITPKAHSVGYPGPSTSYVVPGDQCYTPHYNSGYPNGPITAKSTIGPGKKLNQPSGVQLLTKQVAKWIDKD